MMGPNYIGFPNASRGIRNNNPFNLVKTSIPWKGKITGSDPRFETFANVAWGIRAGLLDLYNDYTRKGQKTIQAIITEFAPPFENDTAAYIRFIENYTGINKGAVLRLQNLVKIAEGIIILENGQNKLSENIAALVPGVANQLPQFNGVPVDNTNRALTVGKLAQALALGLIIDL